MATVIKTSDSLKGLEDELARLANAQFDSEPFQRLLGLRFNEERAKTYIIQRTHWTVNRRECWAQVQSKAPMPVKRVIWEHEAVELVGDEATGKADHYTMNIQEGAALGLTVADFDPAGRSDGCITCAYAWLQLASASHWLSGLAASCALEISNSDEILKDGSMSRRIADKLRDEIGLSFKKQVANVEHMVADIEHARLLMGVAADFATEAADQELVLEGARQSWAIDRIWKGHLADLLTAIPE